MPTDLVIVVSDLADTYQLSPLMLEQSAMVTPVNQSLSELPDAIS